MLHLLARKGKLTKNTQTTSKEGREVKLNKMKSVTSKRHNGKVSIYYLCVGLVPDYLCSVGVIWVTCVLLHELLK